MFLGVLTAILSPLILGTQVIFQKKSNLGAVQQTIISLASQLLLISIITFSTLHSWSGLVFNHYFILFGMSMGICLCLGNLLLIYYVKKVKQFFSSSLKSSIATVISLIISFGVFQEFSGAEEYPYVITSICLVGFLIIIGVFITSFMLSPKEKRGAIFNENSAIELVNTRSILKYKIFLIIVITLSAVLFQAGFCFPKILMHFQTNYTITQNVSLLFPAVLGQILCICLLLPILKLVKSYNPPPFALSWICNLESSGMKR